MRRARIVVTSVVLATVALAIGACGSRSQPPSKATGADYDALVQEGRPLFSATCARCHGGDLKGSPYGPPLLDAAYRPAHHSDAAFENAVRHGVKPHHWNFGPMPPIGTAEVSDAQLRAIIAYVRAEQEKVGIR